MVYGNNLRTQYGCSSVLIRFFSDINGYFTKLPDRSISPAELGSHYSCRSPLFFQCKFT